MAAQRRRARLTPAETAAAVAVTEAAAGGLVENAKPFHRDARLHFRLDVVVPAGRIEAVLAALEGPPEGGESVPLAA